MRSLPSTDRVHLYVAGFASQVHSFDVFVESCMHGVAKNQNKKREKKKGKNINTIVLIYSTGYFLKEKHQRT